MAPPFPKNAPTLARIKALGLAVLAERDKCYQRARQWLIAASAMGLVAGVAGFGNYPLVTVATATTAIMAALHFYRVWTMRNARRHDWIKLPDTLVTDTQDLAWLTWAQWKEPRTRAYLHSKRPNGDFRESDIHDVMAKMSKETDDFMRRFSDPDAGWDALEARRKNERTQFNDEERFAPNL